MASTKHVAGGAVRLVDERETEIEGRCIFGSEISCVATSSGAAPSATRLTLLDLVACCPEQTGGLAFMANCNKKFPDTLRPPLQSTWSLHTAYCILSVHCLAHLLQPTTTISGEMRVSMSFVSIIKPTTITDSIAPTVHLS